MRSLAEELVAAAQALDTAQAAESAARAAQADATQLARRLAAAEELLGEVGVQHITISSGYSCRAGPIAETECAGRQSHLFNCKRNSRC